MTPASDAWAGKSVLVTGAGGFIGSHLAERLARDGADVRAFVRYNSRNDYGWLEDVPSEVRAEIDIFRGDLTNPEAVATAVQGRDVVFHLGALIPIPYSYVHPREYVEANMVGTLNVLEAVRRHGTTRVVHTSTSEAYGTALSVPINEEHPLQAQSPYAATKIAADQLALSYVRSFETPLVVVRPFNTYGPRQSARAVIPTVITQALNGERVHLGSLTPTRDFLFVADNVAGMLAAALASDVEGEVVNLGTGAEISIADLASMIFRLVGREVPVELEESRLRPPASEVERLLADPAKAGRLLGWRAKTGLKEGLQATIEWMQGSLEAYKPAQYNV